MIRLLALVLALIPLDAAAARLLAPASLARVAPALEAAFTAETGDKLDVLLAATAQHARHVAHGLEADAIVTANSAWMDWLAERGLIVEVSRQVLLENRLVLVGPAGAAALPLAALPARISGQRLALCGPGPVPCGIYARDALESLGLWPRLEARIVYGRDAAATRALVESGAVRYGVLYLSDATDNPKLAMLDEISPAVSGAIRYEAAALKAGPDGRRVLQV